MRPDRKSPHTQLVVVRRALLDLLRRPPRIVVVVAWWFSMGVWDSVLLFIDTEQRHGGTGGERFAHDN